MKSSASLPPRPIYVIANEIEADWSPIGVTARPYLVAMKELSSIEEDYYSDAGRSVVAYFLANAGGWKGPIARRVKLELREMLK